MFLFRYGNVPGFANIATGARSELSQLQIIKSRDGGEAELSGVFQIENCVKVFQACWLRLRAKLKQKVNPSHSMLRFLVDAGALQRKREDSHQKAALVSRYQSRPYNGRKRAPNSYAQSRSGRSTRSNPGSEPIQLDTDDEAERLKAGYGVSQTQSQNSRMAKKRASSKKAKKDEKRKRRKTESPGKTTRCKVS